MFTRTLFIGLIFFTLGLWTFGDSESYNLSEPNEEESKLESSPPVHERTDANDCL